MYDTRSLPAISTIQSIARVHENSTRTSYNFIQDLAYIYNLKKYTIFGWSSTSDEIISQYTHRWTGTHTEADHRSMYIDHIYSDVSPFFTYDSLDVSEHGNLTLSKLGLIGNVLNVLPKLNVKLE